MIIWYSRPTILIRSVLRNTFLKSILSKLVYGNQYEEKYSKALLEQIRSSDVVWDIGANIGLYSVQFAKRLGTDGAVKAFEPVPEVFIKLKENTELHPQVTCSNIALSEANGPTFIERGQDPLLATSRIINDKSDSSIQVQAMTGDEFLRIGNGSFPTFLKIDVEGHELSVLKGMKELLEKNPPRVIGVEIHFEKLTEVGEKYGPMEIVHMLQRNYKLKWTDPSHVVCILREKLHEK